MTLIKYFGILSVLFAVWVYWYTDIDLPQDIDEHWKVKVIDANIRTFGHLTRLLEAFGITTPFSNFERKLADAFVLLMTTGSLWVVREDPALTITDIRTEKNNILLRIFEPKTSLEKTTRPVLIYFHGGGFSTLSVDSYDGLTKTLATKSGIVVISVEYRLSPQFTFPVPLEDCIEAVNYVIEHAERLGIDPSRIAVGGDSAGGNMAAAVSLKLRKKIKLQILLVPVLQFFNYNTFSIFENQKFFSKTSNNIYQVVFWLNYVGLGYDHMFSIMQNRHISDELLKSKYAKYVDQKKWMDKKYINSKSFENMDFNVLTVGGDALSEEFISKMTDPYLCPLMADRDFLIGLPRAYVMTAKYDMIRDDGIMYYMRLRDAGVTAHHVNYNTFHNSLTIVRGVLALDIAKAVVQDVVNYMVLHL